MPLSTRETNSANNGKHAKKEFSGRFINKQDFKLRVSGQKKCKLETTASTLQWPGSCRPGPGSSQAGGQKWCRDVKKEPLVKREPLAPQNTVTMDDEVCCLLACNVTLLCYMVLLLFLSTPIVCLLQGFLCVCVHVFVELVAECTF